MAKQRQPGGPEASHDTLGRYLVELKSKGEDREGAPDRLRPRLGARPG